MKRSFLLSGCLVFSFITFSCFNSLACAQDFFGTKGWGISLGRGESSNNIDVYRAGLLKQWNVQWLENKTGYFTGYFELSYSHWREYNRWYHYTERTSAGALSPVFKYVFSTKDRTCYPYVEGGIGVAYVDTSFFHGRDLSSNVLFEDRIGGGIRVKNVDINFRYLHYSNADLKLPNDGIDILICSFSWLF